eukprot:COSAG06_NODE_84_length_25090_cov_20.561042_17_plen_51_part_00
MFRLRRRSLKKSQVRETSQKTAVGFCAVCLGAITSFRTLSTAAACNLACV